MVVPIVTITDGLSQSANEGGLGILKRLYDDGAAAALALVSARDNPLEVRSRNSKHDLRGNWSGKH
jgi:hypothetical protein